MKKIKITPKKEHDQNFLINTKIIKDIIKAIKTNSQSKKAPYFNSILEIGPGTGAITKELALLSKEVVAVEIDKILSIALSSLPKNVTIEYNDALKYLKTLKSKIQNQKSKPLRNSYSIKSSSGLSYNSTSKFPLTFSFDLVFSSLPYKICEPTLKALSTMPGFQIGFFIIPLGFYKKIKKSIYFESFFNITHLLNIPKESFNPIPKSDSCLIKLTKKASLKSNLLLSKNINSKNSNSKNLESKTYQNDTSINYILQKLLSQRTKKAKNALRDAIIDLSNLNNLEYSTKKQAEKLIIEIGLSSKILNTNVYSLSSKELENIKEKLLPLQTKQNHLS